MRKTIISLILIICLLSSSFCALAQDDYTSLLLERGIISGDEKGLRENDPVLRCEFVKMVNRSFNITKNNDELSFNDVHPNDWFYNDFAAAVGHGYVKGDEKGNLNPYDLITRQEAVVMIGRLIGSYSHGETSFSDNDLIASWAKGSVLSLAEVKIITGNTDNSFNPEGKLTRYESFVILTRILDIDENTQIKIDSPFKLYLTDIYPDGRFFLSDNLDLSGKALPLPLCKNGFSGTFNGNGFKISGITTEYNDYALFDTVAKGGRVENLILVCHEYFASVCNINNGTIENCGHNSFDKDGKQYQSGEYFGCFARTNNGIIRSCYTSSFLKVRNDGYIGGICGINNGTVSDCFSTSNGSKSAFGLTVINNSILKNSFCAGALVACKENTGSISYVSFVNSESETGIKTDLYSLKNIYTDYPFTADKNYDFPILSTVAYSPGDNLGEFGGGSGTKDDPFLITSPNHLKNVASYPDAYFIQKNDIDMSAVYDYIPAGNKEAPFSGEYNGNGFLIKNLTIVQPDIKEPALFGTNMGKITDVHLKNCYIRSNDAAASVIYRNYGICSFVTSDALVEAPNAGGIVYTGESSSYVEKSTFNGMVKATNGAGIIHSNNGTVKNCAFTGTINAVNGAGICYNNRLLLEKLFSAGAISANRADDIALSNSGTVTDSYYTNSSKSESSVIRQQQQLVYRESFPALDFSKVWEINKFPLPSGSEKYITDAKENTTDFAGGDGSIANPYKIATPVNFKNITKYPDACFVLINDMDFSIVGTKTPVDVFSGRLDGNGHKITGLDKTSAIFNTNNGTVKDLSSESNITLTNNAVLLNCHITADISGEAVGGICTTNNGLIEKCSFNGNIFATVTGGGICAYNSGIIENCYVSGTVTGKNENSSIYGIAENDGGEIKLCIVLADLYFTDSLGAFYPVSADYTSCRYLDRYNKKYEGALSFGDIANKNSFTGFDFNNVWSFNTLNLPVLKGRENISFTLSVPFRSGDGSKENPYTVSTVSDLYNIRMYPNSHFILTGDISYLGETHSPSILNNAQKGFMPLADFYGSIDGNGHSILGLEILYSDSDSAGLVQTLYGTVKNLNFIDCRIEGDLNCGIVCGNNMGSIENVNVIGSRIGAKSGNCGAFSGINNGSIKNSVNQSDVFSPVSTGGIAGVNAKDITSCTNYGGIVTNAPESNAQSGGISGLNTGVIKSSVNNGKILSYSDLSFSASGGIAGENNGDIINCYNTGQISSKGTLKSASGGICGTTNENSYITNVYNVAYCTSESPDTMVGALIGSAEGKIFNAYYDNTLTEGFGKNNLQRDTSKALSPDRMADINCYENFNTKSVWTTEYGYIYPQLKDNPHIILKPTENIRDFAGGDGSAENPYLIFTPQQLDNVRKYLGSTYMLIGDLDMERYCELNGFEPIGDNIFGFFGTFIGNSNSIKGIKQSGGKLGGLFSCNNGEIYSLVTENFDINASVSGNLTAINTGLVYKCTNMSSISSNSETAMTGGLVGLNKSSGMIIYSANAGDVSSKGDNSQSGGICYGNYGIIAGSFNSGNYVFSEGSKLSMAGGITSFNYGTVSDCYSNAEIYSNDISGGICATNTGNLINCYTTAPKVFGKTAGGICANAQNSFIGNCYYPIDRTEQGVVTGNSEGAIGVNSEELLIQDTFFGFDFENMWVMADGYCPLILEAIVETDN